MKKITTILILFFAISLKVYAQKINVSFSNELDEKYFSGNVLLYLSKEIQSPKDIFVGLNFIPVYRISVENLKADENITFDDSSISYPVELSNIERGEYYVQVVFDRNLGGQHIGSSPGNMYSKTQKINLTKNFNVEFDLSADQVVGEIEFKETDYLKELSVKSKLLSDFHKTEVHINAAVRLPKGYDDNLEKNYPVIFSIFGFGGNYKRISLNKQSKFLSLVDTPVIVVYLDGNCTEGHSVYANSDVNGPWGDALVDEFIPELDKIFKTNNAKLLYGHSSGGWSALWLQIQYPTMFTGTWSSAPDQVDFRNYGNHNIYETDNMFYDKQGNLIADVTIAGRFPIISSKDNYNIENVIYRGGQFNSFSSVFGSYDENGKRIRLVNLPNGEINAKALPYWKRYDISIYLRENWYKLKNDLENKIRISVGEHDNFFLNKPVHILEAEMTKLNASIEFEYFPGDHFTVHTDEYQLKGLQHLEKCYNNWLIKNK